MAYVCRHCGGPTLAADEPCAACQEARLAGRLEQIKVRLTNRERPATASMLEPEPGALTGREQDEAHDAMTMPVGAAKCSRCRGLGEVVVASHALGGNAFNDDWDTCPRCNGSKLEPTAIAAEPAPPAAVDQPEEGYLIDAFSGERVVVSAMDDGAILDWVDAYERQKAAFEEAFAATIASADRILEARLKARGATKIPHPSYACELVQQHGPYQFDVEALKAVQPLLSEQDAAKLVVRHPARTVPAQIVPEHFTPGNSSAIVALAARIKGSKAGEMLAAAISRPSFGTKLVRKRLAPVKLAKPVGE